MRLTRENISKPKLKDILKITHQYSSKCQRHKSQGKSEGPSHNGGDQGDRTSKWIPDWIIEQKKMTLGKSSYI